MSIQHLPGGTKQQPCGEDREQTSAAATFRAIDAATNGTRKSEVLQRLAEIIDSANDKISQQDQRQHTSDQQDKNFVQLATTFVPSRIGAASFAAANRRYSRLRRFRDGEEINASIDIGPQPQFRLGLDLAYQRHNQRLHRQLIPQSSPTATSRIKRYGAMASNSNPAETNRSNLFRPIYSRVEKGASSSEATSVEGASHNDRNHADGTADSGDLTDTSLLLMPANELKSTNGNEPISNSPTVKKLDNINAVTSTNKPILLPKNVPGKIAPRIIANLTADEPIDLDRDDGDDDSDDYDSSRKGGKDRVTPKINLRKNMATSNSKSMTRVISDSTHHTYYFDDEEEEEEDETMHNDEVVADVTSADVGTSPDSLMLFLKMGVDYSKAIKEADDETSRNDPHDDKNDGDDNSRSRRDRILENPNIVDGFKALGGNNSTGEDTSITVKKNAGDADPRGPAVGENMRSNEPEIERKGGNGGNWSSNHSSTSSDSSPYSSSSVSSAWSSSSGSSSFASSTSSSMEGSHVVQSFPSTPTSATTSTTATPDTATLLQKLKQKLHRQQQEQDDEAGDGGEPSSASTLITTMDLATDDTETDETLCNSTGEL